MKREYDDSLYDFEDDEDVVFEMEDDDECDTYECEGYEWTMEDSWDALTDGMYGDMPNNPMDYDLMMDAMGF